MILREDFKQSQEAPYYAGPIGQTRKGLADFPFRVMRDAAADSRLPAGHIRGTRKAAVFGPEFYRTVRKGFTVMTAGAYKGQKTR